MAAAAHNDDEMITSINVTPLVDITLVLLIILMITASYVAAKAIPLDLPKGATAETTPVTLSVSIDKDGKTFLEAAPIDDAGLRAKVRAARAADPETRAVIAADGRPPLARGPRDGPAAPRRGHEVRDQRGSRRCGPLTLTLLPQAGEGTGFQVTTCYPRFHSRRARERQRGDARKR
jgi:biopolymer transport protein ExbD